MQIDPLRSFFFAAGLFLFILPASCNNSRPAQSPATPAGSSEPKLQSVATGLANPLGLTHAGDGSGRIFIVEQGGTIRIVKNGAVSEKPFLDIQDQVTSGGEMGLLGLAFHPDFPEDGRFFLNYTTESGPSGLRTVISEWRAGADPDAADPASERILMTVPQPFSNHNGGHLAFGPDNLLYIGLGDGGSGNDPQNNGQNLATLLGAMLRIDVDPEGGKQYGIPPDNPFAGRSDALPEIWAYGLRNPWRYSFDFTTGFLYVGDVGQNAREEIDHLQKGKNYGWRIMEGSICTPGVDPDCNKTGLTLPIIDYPHSEGRTVVAGYVYRGSAIPDLKGVYLYGDFVSGKIWGLRYDGSSVTDHRQIFDTGRNISSFGEDEQKELYVVDYSGEILKITP